MLQLNNDGVNATFTVGQLTDAIDFARDHGIIVDVTNPESILRAMDEMNRQKYLNMHKWDLFTSGGKWYTYKPEIVNGKLTGKHDSKICRSTRQGLEDYLVGIYSDLDDNPTVEDIFHSMNRDRLDNGYISNQTFDRNNSIFNQHFAEFGTRRIRSVTEDDVVIFLKQRFVAGMLTDKAYGNLRTIVRQVFREAREQKYISFSVEDAVSRAQPPKGAFRQHKAAMREAMKNDGIKPQLPVYTSEEIRVLKAYWKDHPTPHNLALLLMFSTGTRIGEIAALTWDDFDGKCIHITKTEVEYTDPDTGKSVVTVKEIPKTDAGERVIAVPSSVLWIFETLRSYPVGEWLFMSMDPHRKEKFSRLREKPIRNALIKSCKATGIEYRSPHKLRKTYSSALKDSKVDDKYISDAMGHVDVNVDKDSYWYNRRSGEQKVAVVDAVPDLQ